MPFSTTVLLGAIAGFNIYLGLPVAKIKGPSRAGQAFLNSLATGILFFLLWDIITQAFEPVGAALNAAHAGGAGTFILLLSLFVGGFGAGFGAHNATEGFGIAGPLTSMAERPSWKFLGLAGLIGGGPTFLGAILGYSLRSDPVFVLSLALAGGSILYVLSELMHVGRGFGLKEVTMWGIFAGFLLGFGTDLILTWAGV